MKNALTVDVEDYFHVTAFEKHIKTEDWIHCPLRVEENTFRILDLFDDFCVKGTFFVLAWVAERCAALVREIHTRGHDIACHGYAHQLIYYLSPEEFRKDVRKAKNILEDICGQEVRGYRAPSYSITRKSLWALDILIEEGFLYDSSIFPVLHDVYGIPDANRFPHELSRPSGSIKEFPMSTIQIRTAGFEYRVPVSGGGYLRLFPSGLIKKAIHYINLVEGQPAVLYFHPWEIDPKQPRIQGSFKSRFRHYLNLDKTVDKVKSLLESVRFAPMEEILRNG